MPQFPSRHLQTVHPNGKSPPDRSKHVWSTGCWICDDELNSHRIRCTCIWNSRGEPPVSHSSSCQVFKFEGTHGGQRQQPPQETYQ